MTAPRSNPLWQTRHRQQPLRRRRPHHPQPHRRPTCRRRECRRLVHHRRPYHPPPRRRPVYRQPVYLRPACRPLRLRQRFQTDTETLPRRPVSRPFRPQVVIPRRAVAAVCQRRRQLCPPQLRPAQRLRVASGSHRAVRQPARLVQGSPAARCHHHPPPTPPRPLHLPANSRPIPRPPNRLAPNLPCPRVTVRRAIIRPQVPAVSHPSRGCR